MPLNKKGSSPPPVMTWAKAMPIIIVAGVFDLMRMFFEMFWLFGPALAGVACTIGVNDALGTTIAGAAGKVVAGVCTAVAGTLGFYGVGVIEAFGVIMAIAVGLFGWLVIGLSLIMTNARIFKEHSGNSLWFVVSLLVSEVPLIGTLPALTGSVVKMYHSQIKKEKATLKAWNIAHAAEQLHARQQQAASLMQERSMQINQMQEQEAANDELEEEQAEEQEAADAAEREQEAANDDHYTQDQQKAA